MNREVKENMKNNYVKMLSELGYKLKNIRPGGDRVFEIWETDMVFNEVNNEKKTLKLHKELFEHSIAAYDNNGNQISLNLVMYVDNKLLDAIIQYKKEVGVL